MTEQPKYVLVRGTVYKRRVSFRPRCPVADWLRISVPPNLKPGKRSTMPVTYAEERLPEYEVLDEARAKEIQAESLERWKEALRS